MDYNKSELKNKHVPTIYAQLDFNDYKYNKSLDPHKNILQSINLKSINNNNSKINDALHQNKGTHYSNSTDGLVHTETTKSGIIVNFTNRFKKPSIRVKVRICIGFSLLLTAIACVCVAYWMIYLVDRGSEPAKSSKTKVVSTTPISSDKLDKQNRTKISAQLAKDDNPVSEPVCHYIYNGNICYNVNTQMKGWTKQNNYCKGIGMSLVSMNSLEEMNFLRDVLIRDYPRQNFYVDAECIWLECRWLKTHQAIPKSWFGPGSLTVPWASMCVDFRYNHGHQFQDDICFVRKGGVCMKTLKTM